MNVCFAYTGRGYRAGGGRNSRRARRRPAPNETPTTRWSDAARAFDAAAGVMSCSRNEAHLLNVKRTEHDRDRVVRRTALDDVARRLRRVAWDVDDDRIDDDDDDGFLFGIVRNLSLVNLAPRVPPADL